MGTITRKGDDVAARLLALGATAVAIAQALPKDAAGRHIGTQLLRCGTSGGANYEEARAAESPADFVHKLGVAAKEVRETMFWLKLIQQTSMTRGDLGASIREADELVAILIASVRTVRNRKPPPVLE